MLAGMSSLASLAHTAHTAAPAFNGLFYATAATVIPVLFLALAVQGRGYKHLLVAMYVSDRRLDADRKQRRGQKFARQVRS
jgi:hypothetical protein